MNTKVITWVFIAAIVALLSSQTVWLYYSYMTETIDIQNITEKSLKTAIDKELKHRMNLYSTTSKMTLTQQDTSTLDPQISEVEKADVLQASVYQVLLDVTGHPLDLVALDSIFDELQTEARIYDRHLLVYRDSIGNVIDQTGDLPVNEQDKSFRTESVPIVDGNQVYAVVQISPSVVLQRLLCLLIISVIAFCIILMSVYYIAKAFYTQHKLLVLREDFTNALIHDMKTPLVTVSNILTEFQDGVLDAKPEMKEKHGKIAQNQISSLMLLVEKILTISRSEQGRLVPDLTSVDLRKIIKEMEDRFLNNSDKMIFINTVFDFDADRLFELDKVHITNAIANLIDNAVKYSDDPVTINIRCMIDHNNLIIRIKDDGFGISDKDREKIFNKFERGAAVRRKGARGFGLGLAYVGSVAKAHGGMVELVSIEGRGSEFSIVLPII